MSSNKAAKQREKAPLYRFTAIQEDRSPVRGTIRAHSRDSAREQLHFHYFRSNEGLPVYTKGMAVMLDAGLPLAQIFEVAARGEDRYLNEVMEDIGQSIRDGKSLSFSLSRWPSVFDDSFVGMCRAAEKSGRLHITFRRLAALLERRWALKKRLKAALTYPILISVVALAIFWILVAVVVPSLAPSFREIGATLPFPTRVLLWISDLSTSLPAILSLLGLAGVSAFLFYQVVIRGNTFPQLTIYWDRFLLGMPLFGELYRLAILTRSLSTMSALIESGLPMTDVMGIAGEVGGSAVYRRYFQTVLVEIKEGIPLADAMENTGGFPPLIVGVVTLGEESGKLPFMLTKISDLYEEDFENSVQTITTFVEPFLLGLMGLVIGFIVLGTFLPMINLIQQL